ncbi:MAG: hypothetical protein NT002_14265, partial [candidate division Zixibacteria bacterium]|nr:hypothetical protein [candidate division Zixibacteria bacterium]
ELKSHALRYLQYRMRDYDIRKSGIIVKEKFIKELAELAGRIGDLTRRRLFIDEAAGLLQTSPQNLLDLLPGTESRPRPATEIKPPKKIIDIERELLSLIMNHPDHIDTVREKIVKEDFQERSLGEIYSLILTIYNVQGTVSEGILIDMLEDKEAEAEISSLVQIDWHGQNIPLTVKDYVRKILYFKRERIIDRLKGELKIAEEKGDLEKSKQLTAELTGLISRRQE